MGAGRRACTKLELHVFPHNEPAIALYEQLGFAERGLPARRHYRRGGRDVDAILMALQGRVSSGRCRFAEIADSFFTPAVRDHRPVRAGQAGRGGPARARARARRQARVERRAVRAGPRRARGARARRRRAEPLSGRRRVPAARGARRSARRALRGGRARARAPTAIVDCLSQLALAPGDEIVCGWPSFPSYVIYATQARRDRRAPCRSATTATTSRRCSTAIGPRTKLAYVCHPNNPTGNDEHAGRARRVLRARPRTRPHGARPGVLRVRRRPRLRGRGRGVPEGGAAGGRPAHVLEDLRARWAAGRLRVGAGRGRDGDRQGQARLRRDDRRTGGRAREPRRAGRARAPPARERGGARPARADPPRARARPAGPAVANFLFAEVGEDARPLFERCSAKA